MDTSQNDLLQLFLDNAKALRQQSLVEQRELKISTQISFRRGEGVTITRHDIDQEQLESLLVRLRRFNNAKDELHFPRIVNLILQEVTEPDDKDFLRNLKKFFTSRGEHQLLRLKHELGEFGQEDMFNLHINGRIFHADKNKLRKLACLESEDMFSYDMFLNAVINKVNAVLRLEWYILDRIICSEN